MAVVRAHSGPISVRVEGLPDHAAADLMAMTIDDCASPAPGADALCDGAEARVARARMVQYVWMGAQFVAARAIIRREVIAEHGGRAGFRFRLGVRWSEYLAARGVEYFRAMRASYAVLRLAGVRGGIDAMPEDGLLRVVLPPDATTIEDIDMAAGLRTRSRRDRRENETVSVRRTNALMAQGKPARAVNEAEATCAHGTNVSVLGDDDDEMDDLDGDMDDWGDESITPVERRVADAVGRAADRLTDLGRAAADGVLGVEDARALLLHIEHIDAAWGRVRGKVGAA